MGQDDGRPETKNVGGMLALSQEYPRWTPCTENREQGTCLTGEPATLKGVRLVCAVRRFEIFLLQAGGTKEKFLSYQLTQRRKSEGTIACWGSDACSKAL